MAFLQPLTREERFRKTDDGWTIRLVRPGGEIAAPDTTPAEVPTPPAEEASALTDELVSRGVTASTAAEIVRQFAAEAVGAKLEVFDWLSRRNDRRLRVNPAGYLVDSIRKDYAPPQGFESSAARTRRQETHREVAQETEERYRLKVNAEARARAERDAIEDYWRSLTAEQQSRLDADALALADRESWETCKNKPALAKMFRRNLRQEKIRKLLREREAGVAHDGIPHGSREESSD